MSTYPPRCERCGSVMTALVVSWFCPKACDKLDADVIVIREHKLNLGDGWVLWTRNEDAPFGWTWARLVNVKHIVLAERSRKRWTDFSVPSPHNLAWYRPEHDMSKLVIAGLAWSARAVGDYEGFAYKCP